MLINTLLYCLYFELKLETPESVYIKAKEDLSVLPVVLVFQHGILWRQRG